MGLRTGAYVGAYDRFGNDDQVSYQRRFDQVIGNSPALEAVLEQVERTEPTDSSVLIQGENGTGKKLIVRHSNTTRLLTSSSNASPPWNSKSKKRKRPGKKRRKERSRG
jgi:hypothetical protein